MHDVVLGIEIGFDLAACMGAEGLARLIPVLPQGSSAVVQHIAKGTFFGGNGHIHQQLVLISCAEGAVQRVRTHRACAQCQLTAVANHDQGIQHSLLIRLGNKPQIQSQRIGGLMLGAVVARLGIGRADVGLHFVHVGVKLGILCANDVHHLAEHGAVVEEVNSRDKAGIQKALVPIIADPIAVVIMGNHAVTVLIVGVAGVIHDLHKGLVGAINVVGVTRIHIQLVGDFKVARRPHNIEHRAALARTDRRNDDLRSALGVDVHEHGIHVGLGRGVVTQHESGGLLGEGGIRPTILFTLGAIVVVGQHTGALGHDVHLIDLVESVVGGFKEAGLILVVTDKASGQIVRVRLTAVGHGHLHIAETRGEVVGLDHIIATRKGIHRLGAVGGGIGVNIAVLLQKLGIFNGIGNSLCSLGGKTNVALHILAEVHDVGRAEGSHADGLVFVDDHTARHRGLQLGNRGIRPLVLIQSIKIILPDHLLSLGNSDAVESSLLVQGRAQTQAAVCLSGRNGSHVHLLAVDEGGHAVSLHIDPHGHGLAHLDGGNVDGIHLIPAGVMEAQSPGIQLPHTGHGLLARHTKLKGGGQLIHRDHRFHGIVPAELLVGLGNARVAGNNHHAFAMLHTGDHGLTPISSLLVAGLVPAVTQTGVNVLAREVVLIGHVGIGTSAPIVSRGHRLYVAVLVVDAEHTAEAVAVCGHIADVCTHHILTLSQHIGDVKGVVVGNQIADGLMGAHDQVAHLLAVEADLDVGRTAQVASSSVHVLQRLIQSEGFAEQAGGGDPSTLHLGGGCLEGSRLAHVLLTAHVLDGHGIGIDGFCLQILRGNTRLNAALYPAAVPGGIPRGLLGYGEAVSLLVEASDVGLDAPAQANIGSINAQIVTGRCLESHNLHGFLLLGRDHEIRRHDGHQHDRRNDHTQRARPRPQGLALSVRLFHNMFSSLSALTAPPWEYS